MIIGVHGIGQQQFGRQQLLRDWAPAVSDGVEAAVRRVTEVQFDIAFYGDVFLKQPDRDKKGAPVDADLLWDMDEQETADVEEALAEIVTGKELAAAAALPPRMGFPGVPPPFQVALRAIDAKFGAAAGILYAGELRQVRRYLRESALKATVDGLVAQKVAESLAQGPRVLVGHSLGSVVAWEFIRQHPEFTLDLFVTLGSPLGLRMVRSRLPEEGLTGRAPRHVAKWVNVRDRWDPVAAAGDLGHWWPGVEDRLVSNGCDDPHNVCRYLGKAETGSAIAYAIGLGGR